MSEAGTSGPGSTTARTGGGDVRAAAFVKSQPTFETRVGASAGAFGSAMASRFAPLGERAARAPGARALTFADRVAAPHLVLAQRTTRRLAQATAAAPTVNWLFTSPWFADAVEADRVASDAVYASALASGAAASRTPRSAQSATPRSTVAMPTLLSPQVSQASTRRPTQARASSAGSIASARPRSFVPHLDRRPRALAAAELVADMVGPSVRHKQLSVADIALTPLSAVAASAWDQPVRGQGARSTGALGNRSSVASQIASAHASSSPSEKIAPASSRARALELLADVTTRKDFERTVPAALPAVSMPAGLGALDRAIAVRETLKQPLVNSRSIASAFDMTRALTASRAQASKMSEPSKLSEPERGQRELTSPLLATLATHLPRTVAQVIGQGTLGQRSTNQSAAGNGGLASREQVQLVQARLLASNSSDALASISAQAPKAFSRLAWTDRWLARFAGATPQTLQTLAASSRTSAARVGSIGAGFATPQFRIPSTEMRVTEGQGLNFAPVFPIVSGSANVGGQQADGSRASTAAAATGAAVRRPAPQVDEGEPVSDDVFAAIAEGLARERMARKGVSPRSAETSASGSAAGAAESWARSRSDTAGAASAATAGSAAASLGRRAQLSVIDSSLAAVMPWQGGGLAAGLASSPAMAALSATLDLPSASIFDVRALLGTANVSASIAIAAEVGRSPDSSLFAAVRAARSVTARPTTTAELASAWSAPEQVMLASLGSSASGLASVMDSAAERSFVERASNASRAATNTNTSNTTGVDPVGGSAGRSSMPSVGDDRIEAALASRAANLRDLGDFASISASGTAISGASPGAGHGTMIRRSPSIGAIGQHAAQFGSARAASVQDLAFDFVEPEILAAARTFGLGPGQAADAVRLAAASGGQLRGMSESVALTMLTALGSQPSGEQRTAQQAGRPVGQRHDVDTGSRSIMRGASVGFQAGSKGQAEHALVRGQPSGRTARGATLWPAAALRSLNISKQQAPELVPQIGVALELLAAGSVAAAAAASSDPFAPNIAEIVSMFEREAANQSNTSLESPLDSQLEFPQLDLLSESPASAPGQSGQGSPEQATSSADFLEESSSASAAQSAASVSETSAASALGASSPEAFLAIYQALTRDPAARLLSPSARAARALMAVQQTSAGSSISARARAAMAWSVLPTVWSGDVNSPVHALMSDAGLSFSGSQGGTSEAATRGFDGEMIALGAGAGNSASAGSRSANAATRSRGFRAQTAAPALVNTGPSPQALEHAAQRAMAGERIAAASMPSAETMANAEGIPDWFAKAAKHIVGADVGGSASGAGMSMAEMTLVQTAPKAQIAASARGGGSARSQAGQGAGEGNTDGQAQSPDLEEMVHELAGMLQDYFDIQRIRNGE